jgi:ATP-dependent DNA helicase RecG
MNMTETELLTLVQQGESETLEFKRSFDKAAIETIAAFANTCGGTLFIGVEDNGNITGIETGKETIQAWLNQIKQSTSPAIIPDIEKVSVDKKNVVVIRTVEYPIKPVSVKGRYVKRNKNSNHLMDINEVTAQHLKTFNTSWDYYIDDHHTMDDISLEKVRQFIERTNKYRDIAINDDPFRVLHKFELTRDTRLTYGGFLLFMAEESALTTMELGRFQTGTIIKDNLTLKSDLFSQLDRAMDFIKKHLNKAYIITGNIQREERWDYPLDAIREIVVNAIVHRDYRNASDSIIKIYDDRIEFFNPGKLPEGLSIERLLSGNYTSTIRNKKIAEIFKEAGAIEKYGSGISRIREGLRNHGLQEPVFEEIGNGFRVIVKKAPLPGDKKSHQTARRWALL